MAKLIVLYLGTIFLAYLSQVYYPVRTDGISEKRHFMRDKTDIFCIAIIIWLTLFNGLKTVYNDTGNYIMYFRDSATTLGEHFATSTETGFADNPLYYITQLFSKRIIDNYHVWFLLVAFFNAWIVVKFLKHYSENFTLTIMVFHALGTYLMYLAAIKQSIAIGILLIAIPYLLRKKWITYYTLVILAILFHTHAFLFLVLPLFVSKPWSKLTFICIGITVFAMATYDDTLGAFMEYAQSIGANVAAIEVFDDMTVSPIRVAVYAVIPLISLFFNKHIKNKYDTANTLFLNMSILSLLILSIGLVNGANLFARMVGYFELGIALSLPWLLNKIFTQKSRQLVYTIAFLCFSVYFIYDSYIIKDFNHYRALSILDFIKSLFV